MQLVGWDILKIFQAEKGGKYIPYKIIESKTFYEFFFPFSVKNQNTQVCSREKKKGERGTWLIRAADRETSSISFPSN